MPIKKDLGQLITPLKLLPTLPHITLKVMETYNQDNHNAEEIAKIIKKDPSLSFKIMGLAHSVCGRLNQNVKSIEEAVSIIGIEAIHPIVYWNSEQEDFYRNKERRTAHMIRFWRHSYKSAVLAKLISEKISYNQPDMAFLSGLLHDIGKLVLWVNFPDQYDHLVDTQRAQKDVMLVNEMELSATHAEAGASFLNRWNVHSLIADSVLYHHESIGRISGALPMVKIVYVANGLAQETVNEALFEVAEAVFKFSTSDIDKLLSLSDGEVADTAISLKIETGPVRGLENDLYNHDFIKKEKLIREFRDISLLLGTPQHMLMAGDKDAVMKVIQLGFNILFDVKNIFFFLYNAEKDALIGKTISEDKNLAAINNQVIPLEIENSLFITSLRQNKIFDSFGHSGNSSPVILDKQILRLIGTEGMICLPMVAHGENVGVLVLGLDAVEFSYILEQLPLLTTFTNQSALNLRTVCHIENDQRTTFQQEESRAPSIITRKIYHEINNPLAIIKNYLKVLERKLADQNIVHDEIRIINEEIDRVRQIMRSLEGLSEEGFSKKESVDINVLLSELIMITRESFLKDHNIAIKTQLDPAIPSVNAYKNGLKQVFINLMQNAAEAMIDGGTLHIHTRIIYRYLRDSFEKNADKYQSYVEIIFSDEGTGIPDEIQSRLFEPNVSSKGRAHAGLGLAIVHNIIKTLKGDIIYETMKGKGTRFRIELPVVK